ncbi:transglycosylase domain-containing protein [Aeromicrobium sp. UC242_57]
MARLSGLGGLLVAMMLIPATAVVAITFNKVTNDVVDLPLTLEDQPSAQTTRLLASDGSLIAYFYKENRQDVPLKDIAPVMQDAQLAIEDNRFYEHGALDLKGTLRALVNNASDGQTQGGSSITQQLVKLTLVSQAKTKDQVEAATKKSTARKIRELKLAIQYEETHSKDEILERYLNLAYYGAGAYGISAAADRYFSRSPDKLQRPAGRDVGRSGQEPRRVRPQRLPREGPAAAQHGARGHGASRQDHASRSREVPVAAARAQDHRVPQRLCRLQRRVLLRLCPPVAAGAAGPRRDCGRSPGSPRAWRSDDQVQYRRQHAEGHRQGRLRHRQDDRHPGHRGARLGRAGHRQGARAVAVAHDGSQQEEG